MTSPPSIRISQHQRYTSPPSYPSHQPDTASPMPIPKIQDSVPPPLPPPTHLPEISTGQDPGWQWGNDPASTDFGRSAAVKPGSSLLGGDLRNPLPAKELEHTRNSSMDDGRRGSSFSTIVGMTRDVDMPDAQPTSDEESATRSRSGSNYRLQSERRLEQTTFAGSSNAYDKQLLSRIGGPSTPDSKRQSVSSMTLGSGLMQETAQAAHAESERRNSQLKPLTVPSHERRQNSISDSPANTRFPTSVPSSGAISPGFAGFWEHGPADSNLLHTRNGSLSSSHRGSYDNTMFANDEMEESRMGHLQIHDRSPPGYSDDYANGIKAGTKRRASDLYCDERSSISSASGATDAYHRKSVHQQPERGSPVARFQPSHSSLSSASSYAPRHGSFGSSLGIPSVPSSATSYASGRVSPSILSPAIDPELARARTPSGSGQSLKPSPILPNPHHGRTRTLSSSTQGGAHSSGPESTPHSRQSSLSQLPGIYICECCPKKPKKFDTEDDLRLHESEKQYSCAYCPNRFKNKNEAERHQNSLHLRRHSWSCAALAGPEAAFHPSMNGSGADVCGYCGDEFSNPPRWEARAEHLNHVHKFGECNKAKKFFRADHFRQHLKHSHAGTSGKWTNMLENACMKDEPLPEKRAGATSGGAPQAPPALMVTTTGLTGSPVQCSNLLERDPNDC